MRIWETKRESASDLGPHLLNNKKLCGSMMKEKNDGTYLKNIRRYIERVVYF